MSRVVISANLLDDLRREGRDIAIPRSALLTPAARDWLREAAYPVAWIDEQAGPGKNATVGVVGDFAQPALRSLRIELDRLAGGVERFESPDSSPTGGSLLPALGKLCRAVQGGKPGRGVVFVEDGAIAACVASKFRGIRACVGNGVASTHEAVRDLGINVLVIEPSKRTFHEMRQMIRRLLAESGRPSEAVSQAIAAAEAAEAEASEA